MNGIKQEKRAQNNESSMNIYSLIRERSIEDMSAVGKNLSFQAVIAAGGNVSSNIGGPLGGGRSNSMQKKPQITPIMGQSTLFKPSPP
jgi:hypothetical protein